MFKFNRTVVFLAVAVFTSGTVSVADPGPESAEDHVHTMCSKSKVSYEKVFMRHNWRVAGLIDYADLVDKFNLPLQVTSDNVKFENTRFSGKWSFTISKDKNAQPITLTAVYQYESITADPELVVYDMAVTAFIDDTSIELPLRLSPVAELQGQRQDYKPGVAYQYVFDFVHKFKWEDLMSHLSTLLAPPRRTSTLAPRTASQDIDFRFFITAYVPSEVTSSNMSCLESAILSSAFGPDGAGELGMMKDDDSGENLISAMPARSKRLTGQGPPFLRNMEMMMKEDNFTDMIVKTGDDEFPVHKVILAGSSPILANMIKNLTAEKNESVLDLGAKLGSDVVEALVKYIYTGTVDAIEEIADRLILAATKYDLPNLKFICEAALLGQVKVENAISMYTLGKEANSTKLVRRAFTIMKANKTRIASQPEDFRKLSVHYPHLMFELFLS